jgi:hypothetical protein
MQKIRERDEDDDDHEKEERQRDKKRARPSKESKALMCPYYKRTRGQFASGACLHDFTDVHRVK